MTLIKPRTPGNPGPHWKYDFWHKKKRFHQSTGTTSRTKAALIEAKARLAAIENQDAITMEQLGEWDVYRATHKGNNEEYIEQIARYWQTFAEYFKTSANVNMVTLTEYANWRRKKISRYGDPIGNRTINRELMALSRGPALAEAYGQTILKWPNRAAWPRQNKTRKRAEVSVRPVNAELLKKYMAAQKFLPRLHTYLRIVTGLRREELERVSPEHIEEIEGVPCLHVREKVVRDTARIIPLTPLMVRLIRTYYMDFVVDHKKANKVTALSVGLRHAPHPRTLRSVFTSAAGMSLDPNGVNFLCGRNGGINAIYEKASVARLMAIMAHVHAAWPANLLGNPRDFPHDSSLRYKKNKKRGNPGL